MIDDAKIRMALLHMFPHIERSRFEMEEYEFGDILGVTYYNEGVRHRCHTQAKGREQDEIVQDLARGIAGWVGVHPEDDPTVAELLQAASDARLVAAAPAADPVASEPVAAVPAPEPKSAPKPPRKPRAKPGRKPGRPRKAK